jgi:hypothetical protein
MFNIGALCSQLAAQQLSFAENEESLKSSVRLLNQAAGAFQHLLDEMTTLVTRGDCTFDMYPETLSLLSAIMLAQAQEIICVKATMAGQLSVASRLALCCSQLYDKAVQLHQPNRIHSHSPQIAVGHATKKLCEVQNEKIETEKH